MSHFSKSLVSEKCKEWERRFGEFAKYKMGENTQICPVCLAYINFKPLNTIFLAALCFILLAFYSMAIINAEKVEQNYKYLPDNEKKEICFNKYGNKPQHSIPAFCIKYFN